MQPKFAHTTRKTWSKAQWEEIRNDAARVAPVAWKTWAVLLFDLALGAAAIALHNAIEWHQFWSWSLSVAMMTVVFLHFYLLLHEGTHNALFKDRRLNDLAGQMLGWAIACPYLPRKRSHLLHHLHAGHPVLDRTNRRMIEKFSVFTENDREALEFVWGSWLPMMAAGERIRLALSPFVEKDRTDAAAIGRERRWSWIYLAGYLLALAGLVTVGRALIVLTLYLPTIFILFILEEMINLPHHAESELLDENEKSLPYWRQHIVTHSCRSVPIWSRWILLNFNLHTAHHLYPWAPWHELEKIHKVIIQYPELTGDGNTGHNENEFQWSITRRRKPLLGMMGKYFDKIPTTENCGDSSKPIAKNGPTVEVSKARFAS